MNTEDTSDDSAILAKIAQLEKQVQEAEKAAREPGGWGRYNALNTELHELKQTYFRERKARRRAAAESRKPDQQPGVKQAGADPTPDAPKHAQVVKTSCPGRPEGYTDPDEQPLCSGDGPCPNCKTMLWIVWKYSYDLIRCPNCKKTYDGEAAVAIASGFESEKNTGSVDGSIRRVLKTIRMKEQLRQRLESESTQASTRTPTTREAGGGTGGTSNRNSPVYGDCPSCGMALNLTDTQPEQIAGCPRCGVRSHAKSFLNLRATPERVDPRGWLARRFLGSGLQKSLREQRVESRANLEANINSCRGLITLAQMSNDYQKALFYQRRLEQLEQQLEDFDNDE